MTTNDLLMIEINHKTCYISGNVRNQERLPVFYWGIMKENTESIMTVVSYLKQHLENRPFLLVAYEADNWNDDFSPWKAAPVFGTEGFGGGADKTLKWLVDDCIPYIEAEDSFYTKGAAEVSRFTVGYSLAGLFSLWAYCECDLFTGAVCCSGSLWYDGWLDYIDRRQPAFDRKGLRYLYLSLGDKEEKTKNKRMAAVGDNTRALSAFLNEKRENIICTLEWNRGGHFSEPEMRVIKGIVWVTDRYMEMERSYGDICKNT
ncbi:MAG: alpha/beta hydrolase [Lachnospiraceae bacterium]|nr:alpha/beta hydrolase [Lachnospiraceae bacterium]